MKTTIRSLAGSFALLCLTVVIPKLQAVVPPPDGGYPNNNTAEGTDALFNLTTGFGNTAIGADALYSNTTGNFNTANGNRVLESNTEGYQNTASGAFALSSNTTGNNNTAIGTVALNRNTTGNNNTADGVNALLSNTTGTQNTATGTGALHRNTIGNNNTADGFQALLSNTGASNTAIGSKALLRNVTGSSNIGLGVSAGAFTTGSNNIAIGNFGSGAESNTIRIGQVQTRTFIKGISGVAIAGAPVVVNAGGQLGVAPSSANFKTEIKPMDKASEAILSLKPVTFRYKKGIDASSTPQFGLVADEVEKVNPALVVHDTEGKPYTVRYDAVNAMLLNEFLKEHRKNEEQQKQINVLTAQLNEQAAQIQKVSAQLEASKPAPQVVNNP